MIVGVDSDCIIDFLKGKPDAIRAVERHQGALVTTEINRFEVLFGIHANPRAAHGEHESAVAFFDTLDVLPLTRHGSELASKLLGQLARTGNIINQNDALIAATLKQSGSLAIITGNASHFRRIPGLRVIDY